MTTHALELQPVPSVATTSWQQFRLLAWSARWLWLTGALLALLMLSGFAPALPFPRPILVGLVGLPVGVFWAMTVWQNETPTRRFTHWALPVSRPLSDLSRVLAGAFFLLVAYAVLAAAGALWASISDETMGGSAPVWIGYFLAPLIVYLMVMPLILWSEYSATKWLMAALFCYPLTMMLLESRGITRPSDGFVSVMVRGDLSLASALFDPMLGNADANWWLASLLWLAFGVMLTIFAATFRPDDLRRLPGARRRDGGRRRRRAR